MSVKGIDIYHDTGVNWASLSPDIKFVYCKGSQGLTYHDPKFQEYWNHLKNTNLLRGAYHFLTTDQTAQEQADNFLRLGIDFSKPNVLPPALDIEDQVPASLNAMITRNKAGFIQLATDWINIVQEATKRSVVIYSYKNFFAEYLNNHSWPNNPLWLAAYQSAQPGLPLGYTHLDFWQNSENGTLGGRLTGGQIDEDLFLGSIDQLASL